MSTGLRAAPSAARVYVREHSVSFDVGSGQSCPKKRLPCTRFCHPFYIFLPFCPPTRIYICPFSASKFRTCASNLVLLNAHTFSLTEHILALVLISLAEASHRSNAHVCTHA
eukprot:1004144-Pleurochrysis_carterae.AAC.2